MLMEGAMLLVVLADQWNAAVVRSQLGFDEPTYLFRLNPSPLELADERLGGFLGRLHLPGSRSGPAGGAPARSDERSDSMAQLEQTFLLELAVNPRHGVWLMTIDSARARMPGRLSPAGGAGVAAWRICSLSWR